MTSLRSVMEGFFEAMRLREDRLRMSYEDEIGAINRNLRTETKKKNYLLKKTRSSESGGIVASVGEGIREYDTINNKRQKKCEDNVKIRITRNENNNINMRTINRDDGLADTKGIILCKAAIAERSPIHKNHKIKLNKLESTSSIKNTTRELKFIETVRGRDARDALPGFACSECELFYEAMVQQGIIEPHELTEHLRECSRHKARWKPPSTPEGFWDLTIRTPEDWKHTK